MYWYAFDYVFLASLKNIVISVKNMNKILFFVIIYTGVIFSETFIFNEENRITFSSNDQRFPETIIHNNIIHLTWVSANGNDKNIFYAKSYDNGITFSVPIQINYNHNNIIAYNQSGPKIEAYHNNIFITFTDNRSGYTDIYLSTSSDEGDTWEQEILISDTPHTNMYQDIDVDDNGKLHLVYFNFGSNYHLEDVRYRKFGDDSIQSSIRVGLVTNEEEPCDCCQPVIELDQLNNIYIAYRNNIQNIRDTYLAIKRYNESSFSEPLLVSYMQDQINFCPSSGPAMRIKNNEISIAYTSYNHQNIYTSSSSLNDLDFNIYTNVNPENNSFQNYPFIALGDNSHLIWVDFENYDIYYGMYDKSTDLMHYIQRINHSSESINLDPILIFNENMIYSFWSSQVGNYFEIYFSKTSDQTILLGDINLDSYISIIDILEIINIINGSIQPTNFELIASDLNMDGNINIQDIILIINIIIN